MKYVSALFAMYGIKFQNTGKFSLTCRILGTRINSGLLSWYQHFLSLLAFLKRDRLPLSYFMIVHVPERHANIALEVSILSSTMLEVFTGIISNLNFSHDFCIYRVQDMRMVM